jgi:RNA polymerase sigma factor (sigma-70 family)
MPGEIEPLLRRIASGDREAFARLYDEWFDTVLAQCSRAARGNPHDASDIAQDVFMKFIRRTPILDSPAALGAWFKRAAFTTARDRALAESRRRARETRRTPTADRPGSAVAHAETLPWLTSELAGIDAETRDLLTQRFVLGRTLSQMGRLFGLAPGAVDGRIRRVLAQIRRRAPEAPHE